MMSTPKASPTPLMHRRRIPRRFILRRDHDTTGISGTGDIAYGCEFIDGSCVLRWDTRVISTAYYDTAEDLLAIHGHDGDTRIEWLD